MDWKLACATVAVAVLSSGCASITGTSNQSVSLQTLDQGNEEVVGAACELSNSKGKWFVATPGSVVVNRSNEAMQVLCTKAALEPGRESVVSDIKPAMFGNVIFGGVIGVLIDHSTGAGYEYPTWIRIIMKDPSKSGLSQTSVPLAPVSADVPTVPLPSASLTPVSIVDEKTPLTGDEWEYIARDNLFGKQKTLLWRVKTADSAGVMEELLVDGKPALQWSFSDKAALVAVPIETGFFFGPHWNGKELPSLRTDGGVGDCAAPYYCKVDAKIAGYERITVAAGTFDAVRVDGAVTMHHSRRHIGSVSIWYSENSRHLLRQICTVRSRGISVNETLELQAARAYR